MRILMRCSRNCEGINERERGPLNVVANHYVLTYQCNVKLGNWKRKMMLSKNYKSFLLPTFESAQP